MSHTNFLLVIQFGFLSDIIKCSETLQAHTHNKDENKQTVQPTNSNKDTLLKTTWTMLTSSSQSQLVKKTASIFLSMPYFIQGNFSSDLT